MSKHTKEPWDGDYAAIFVSDVDIAMCVDHDVGREVSIANARRIVACVNACAGIADPFVVADMVKLIRQQHEIVVDAIMHGMPVTKEVADARNIAVYVLAKLDGKETSELLKGGA